MNGDSPMTGASRRRLPGGHESSRITGIVLAAGAATRFGGGKAVARFQGERLVDRAVATLTAGGCDRVLVVVGALDVGAVHHAILVLNSDWQTGMGSSLRAGLSAARDAEAVVVTLVDQPLIGAEAVKRLVEAWRDGAPIAVATYEGRRAHPVLFGREAVADLLPTLTGDAGARDFLASRSDVVAVDCTDTGRPDDVDTVEALRRLSP
ncbi:CTP:molybdopterin cytidylyltransferase MocA [Catenulispora sp. GAS73]|uniref:nucleotidyltransferase family protein n=1 Tax=Catenulispora sp. GAS73 TaxID=3156269 RepID=UPI003518D84A